MDVRVIDRARNVTTVPTETLSTEPGELLEALDSLLHRNAGPRTEIECDAAFFETIRNARAPDGTGLEHRDPQTPPVVATWRGVPVIVKEG